MNTAEFPLHEITWAIARRWRSMLALAILLGLAGLGISLLLPRVYVSESKLLVRIGRENSSLDPTVTMGEQHVFNVPPSREEEINSVVEVLNARYLAHQVVYQVGPDLILNPESVAAPFPVPHPEPPSLLSTWVDKAKGIAVPALESVHRLRNLGDLSAHEGAIITLMKNLQVEAVKDSCIVKLSYESSDPRAAQKILDTLVAAFLEHHVHLHRMPGGAEFLARQTEEAHATLEDLEGQLVGLKRAQQIVSTEDERHALVARLADLRKELLTTQADRVASQAMIRGIEEKMDTLPDTETVAQTSGRSREAATGMRQKLYELQLEEKQLTSRYSEDHFRLQQVRQQLSAAQAILSGEPVELVEVTRGPGPEYTEARRMLMDAEPRHAALQAKEAELTRQIEQVENDLATYIQAEREISDLMREKELNESRYRRFAAELQRAEIDQEMEAKRMSNIGIAEPATLEARPRSPNPILNGALGAFLGLVMGVSLAMWSEMSSSRVRTEPELESLLSVPVLARVPRLPKHQLYVNGRSQIGMRNAE